MRKFRGAQVQTAALAGAEKRRLFVMGIGVLVLFGALLVAQNQREPQVEPEEPVIEARIELPAIPVEELRAEVRDGDGEARVRLERGALDRLQQVARRLTVAHYDAMGIRDANGELVAEIAQEPDLWRGKPILARGRLLVARTRAPGGERPSEQHITVDLEHGGRVHAVLFDLPEGLEPGDWLVLRGLFLKVYSNEGPAGEWIDAPLLVGLGAERSAAPLGPMGKLNPDVLATVVDDTLQFTLGLEGPGRYELLAHARDADPTLYPGDGMRTIDRTVLEELLGDPVANRGDVFLLPISRVENARVLRLGENPARLDEVTELWIGNTNWDKSIPAVGVHIPGRIEGLRKGTLVQGQLLFYKNFAFDTGVGTRRVAPFFAGLQIAPYVPPDNTAMRQVLYGVAALSVAIIVLLALLVRRDRRRAQAFEREQLARRQERRGRAANPAAARP